MALWIGWDSFPGTLRFDRNGFPHGTGTNKYYYKTGPLMLEERYRAGFLYQGTWHRPDGSVVATATVDRKNGGPWYYLREDGTIRARMEHRYDPKTDVCVAHGTAVYYNPDGSVERKVEYRDGSPVDSKATKVGP
jgi:antitoxin component YwqK of YwqJK toxin-antitoxin module